MRGNLYFEVSNHVFFHPFDRAKAPSLKAGNEARLRVNLEPFDRFKALSLSKGKPRPSGRGAERFTKHRKERPMEKEPYLFEFEGTE